MANSEQQHGSNKVHGDKLATGAGHTAAAPGAPGGAHGADGADDEPGTGGLMPGNYEQGGGDGGHPAGEHGVAHEDAVIRAPGSRVPHPESDPGIRQRALDIANGGPGQP